MAETIYKNRSLTFIRVHGIGARCHGFNCCVGTWHCWQCCTTAGQLPGSTGPPFSLLFGILGKAPWYVMGIWHGRYIPPSADATRLSPVPVPMPHAPHCPCTALPRLISWKSVGLMSFQLSSFPDFPFFVQFSTITVGWLCL